MTNSRMRERSSTSLPSRCKPPVKRVCLIDVVLCLVVLKLQSGTGVLRALYETLQICGEREWSRGTGRTRCKTKSIESVDLAIRIRSTGIQVYSCYKMCSRFLLGYILGRTNCLADFFRVVHGCPSVIIEDIFFFYFRLGFL